VTGTADADADAEIDWRRAHPLTTIVLVATMVANNLFPLLIALGVGGGIGFDLVGTAIAAFVVGAGGLGWYMTRYVVTDDAVKYRSGVLNRQEKSIPLDRIQQVTIAQAAIPRVFGLASVQVSEASADGDIEIQYLGKSTAEVLTAHLRSIAAMREDQTAAFVNEGEDAAGQTLSAPAPTPAATMLHKGSLRDLVMLQLAAVAPALALVFTPLLIATALSTARTGLLVLALAVALFVLFVGATVGSMVMQNGGFLLHRGPRSLTIKAGLLSRRQVEVRPDRIQTITIASSPVARWLDLHEIRFAAATGKAVAAQKQRPLLSPAAHTNAVSLIVQGAVDVDPGLDVEFEPVSPLTTRRALVRATLLYLFIVLPASVGLSFETPLWVAIVPSVVYWPLTVCYVRARYRRLGISIDAQRFVARRGVLVQQLTQLPLINVQSASTAASFFQRRLGLADLVVSTAGIGPANHVRVVDLPVARADELRAVLGIAAAESTWELEAS
jgi:putative membrane protein